MDYYQILGVPSHASDETIRKAYKRLMHILHPDKNAGDAAHTAQFIQVREAYVVLSDPQKRAAYDMERYLTGKAVWRSSDMATAVQWEIKIKELRRYIASMDATRMDHLSLKEYMLLLFSDEQITLISIDTSLSAPGLFYGYVYPVLEKLQYPYILPVSVQICKWLSAYPDITDKIQVLVASKKKQAIEARYLPWFVMLCALLLCVFLYIIQKR